MNKSKMFDVRVTVLEGDFAHLCYMGLPLAVATQLQQMDLKLYEALWTAKCSSSGFSVSLYWPTGEGKKNHL